MYSCNVLNFLITILVSCSVSSPITSTGNLSGRARFSNFNAQDRSEVYVGLATPHPICDSQYGQPDSQDCFRLSQQIISSLDDGRSSLHEADDEWATTRREFKQRGTVRTMRPVSPVVDVPLSYAYGTCHGLLDLVTVVSGSQPQGEFATWRDVWSAESGLHEICIDIPMGYGEWTGGKQRFGQFNNLVLYLYSAESSFGEQQREASSDCSNIPDYVVGNIPCGTRRQRQDSETDDDATSPQQPPAQRPRVCSAAPGSRYSDQICCDSFKGYRWTPVAISKAIEGVLFGLGKLLEEGGIGFCEAAVGSS